MAESVENTPGTPVRVTGRRGASTAAAAAILIVVIVVVGAGGYFGLNAATPKSTAGTSQTGTSVTCYPPTASYCKNSSSPVLNDVVLTVPYQAGYGQTVSQVPQNTTVPASLSVSGGETVNSWSVNWGDGSTNMSSSSLLTHNYQSLGLYAISGTAAVGSATHTGTGYLFPVEVTPSESTSTSGFYPTITSTFSNGTNGAFDFPWLKGSGSVTVSAGYSAQPSNPSWYADTPSIIASSGASITAHSGTSTSANATVSFSGPGVYAVTFVGPVKDNTTGQSLYANYTWGVYVSPTNLNPGCGSCAKSGSNSNVKDPHPGVLDVYEVAPGGATSVDPSVDYESVGYEPILNVYETLVQYNGSSTASFLPMGATCVPGTASCNSLYGQTLVQNNGAGQPTYWTFVLDKNAQFYDPATGAHWGVYPSDVMFSLARTASFADLPFFGANPGWIETQALTQIGSPTWDGGLHFPFNNTPQGILGSMFVNNSQYCPAAAMTGGHGCITFNASGEGQDWPYFLELISDNLGASILPCGWFEFMGAGMPGFSYTAAKGDGPCTLPGGGTSTNDSSFQSYLTSTSPTAYDNFQLNSLNSPAVFPQTRWNAVGSGPYYLVSISKSIGYVEKANPFYAGPNCVGLFWCAPAAGQYASTVNVYWEPSDQVGIQQYLNGKADFAGIQTTDTSTMLALQQAGKIGIQSVPSIAVFFDPINMQVDLGTVGGYYTGTTHLPCDPGTCTSTSGPSNFFSYVGLRQFLVHAFPYTSDLQNVLSVDGINYGINYGGAIPHFMGNYYATNVTWPAGNPDTNPADVGSAAWWWAQATSSSSPYYDPLLSQCTTSNPCSFPVAGEQGDTLQNGQYPLWIPYVSQISGGRIQMTEVDLTFSQLVTYSITSLPGHNPLTDSVLGWLPDYPDPTDYVAPMYQPNATYTAPSAVYQALSNDTAAGCTNQGGNWANLVFWAKQFAPANNCQGVAYDVMTWAEGVAGALPVGPTRTLYYNLISHIANELALYVYQFQEQGIGTYAPWISQPTLNQNVVYGGDGLWYEVSGNGFL